ncbi:unnamed protein product, partial [Ixodes persulcatus]
SKNAAARWSSWSVAAVPPTMKQMVSEYVRLYHMQNLHRHIKRGGTLARCSHKPLKDVVCSNGTAARWPCLLTGMSRQQVLEWCIDRGCELIETRPSEDDDEEDATGVKRIVEALHAHPWPNLEMKGRSDTRTRRTYPDCLSSPCNRFHETRRNTELELFSEAMADGDDMSFEELFAKFQDMKVEADKLSGEDRKKFAEKVAVQFWRAFGGEEDEVCGLSSDDEAEK